MIKKLRLIIVCIATNMALYAQDNVNISFYKEASMILNPSTAGFNREYSILMLNRNSVGNEDAMFRTTFLSADFPAKFISKNSNLGLNIVSNAIGNSKMVFANINYSNCIKQSWGRVGVGTSLGISDNKSESGNLALDIALGGFIKTNKAYAWLSVVHINNAGSKILEQSMIFLARNLYFSAGYTITPNNGKIKIEPSIIFANNYLSTRLDVNADAIYNECFMVGAGIGINGNIIARMSCQFRNKVRIGYAYNSSEIENTEIKSGIHEVYLKYSLSFIEKNTKAYKSVRYL